MHKFFLLALMVFLSCKKEPVEYQPIGERAQQCYQAVSFLCYGHNSTEYFSCKLDGEDFCMSYPNNSYTIRKDVARNYLTNGPVLDPRDSSAARGSSLIFGYASRYQPSLFFEVSDTSYADLHTMIERHLKVGQNLPFRKKGVFQSEGKTDWTGFTVYIGIPCDSGQVEGSFRFATTNHDQSGSYLRCTRLEKTETPTQTIYHIRMEFACNMQQEGATKARWRKLSDGVLDIRIPVDK